MMDNAYLRPKAVGDRADAVIKSSEYTVVGRPGGYIRELISFPMYFSQWADQSLNQSLIDSSYYHNHVPQADLCCSDLASS